MTIFGEYITPEEAKKLGDERSLSELKELLTIKDEECVNCSNKIWLFGHGAETGLCFTCTTGEADASEDYELI